MYIYIYIYTSLFIHFSIYKIYTYILCTRFVKKQGLSDAQFGYNVNSELCIRLLLFFYTWGPHSFSRYSFFSKICDKSGMVNKITY